MMACWQCVYASLNAQTSDYSLRHLRWTLATVYGLSLPVRIRRGLYFPLRIVRHFVRLGLNVNCQCIVSL